MTNTLEELTADTLSRDYVEKRLDDWARRIDDLYQRIASWAAPEWVAAAPHRRVRIFEPPMREVGADERSLPVLELRRDDGKVVNVRPASLWIIGSNGRLELGSRVGRNTTHYISDEADHFEPPTWVWTSIDDQVNYLPLVRDSLLSILDG